MCFKFYEKWEGAYFYEFHSSLIEVNAMQKYIMNANLVQNK